MERYSIQQRLPISQWEDFYLAKDLQEGRDVCLVAFQGNMKEAAQVPSHRSLPIIYEIVSLPPENRVFAVLEFVRGIPFLQAVRSKGALEILRLFRELLEGIDHMHTYGLLHRRIKAGNMIVQQRGKTPTARFLSWGLAIPKEKSAGDKSGAKHYLAPEILLKGEVTELADLWALGALLCKALTGEFPFPDRKQSNTIQQLMTQAKRELLPEEFKIKQTCREPKKLRELLAGLLHLNPQKRFFKNARQVINFIDTNWREVATIGEEEQTTEMVTL